MADRTYLEDAALPLRQNIAQFVFDAIAVPRRAVLIWLWDPEWRVYVLNRHAPRAADDLFPALLRRRVAAGKRAEADLELDATAWALSIDDQPALRSWAEARGVTHEELFAVWRTNEAKREPLAFVHVLTDGALDADSRRAIEEQLVGVGTTIVRSRGERQLQAVTGILQRQADYGEAASRDTAQRRWLETAATTLTGVTRARACVVFRPGEARRWESVAAVGANGAEAAAFTATPAGLVAEAAKRGTPIRDYDLTQRPLAVADAEMLARIASTLATDDAFSCLAVPVLFHAEAIAVFLLVNKRAEFHLAEAFTMTDQEAAVLVAQLLAGVIPTFQLYEAVERAGEIGAPGMLDDPSQRARLFELVQRMLPQVAGAAVISRPRREERLASRMLGGEAWFGAAEEVVAHTAGAETKSGLSLALPIPNVRSGDAFLALLLRAPLTVFDKQLVSAFRTELSHALHAEDSVRAALDVAHQTQHALRAPLTLVTGQLRSARKRLEVCRNEKRDALSDGQLRDSLKKADAEAQMLLEALDRPRFLLADIRPETLRVVPGSLASAIEEARTALSGAAAQRRVRIECEGGPPAEANFDRELMYHALFNVIENAVKYGLEDSVVRVALERAGTQWRISIANAGSYVAPEDRERIFQPFFRTRQRGQVHIPGTGIGLALVKAVVTAHGGTVSVESEAGDGAVPRTRFIISLPAARPTSEEVPAVRGRVSTIHHLDDEPWTIDWIGAALRDDIALLHGDWKVGDARREAGATSFSIVKPGGELTVVHRTYESARDFLQRFPEHVAPHDIVVLDVMSEDAGGAIAPHGLEAYELAARHLGSEAAIFFLTGYPRSLLAGGRAPSGATVLSKPVAIDAFLRMMTRSLRLEL